MKRRRALGGLAGLLAGGVVIERFVAGTSPIVEREFSAFDPATQFYDAAPEATAPSRVTFHPDESRVRIVGKLFVGSSSCDRAALERATYDGRADSLLVTVGSETKPGGGHGCTGDESADAYRVSVTFEERLPETVAVEEAGDVSTRETTVKNPNAVES
jgi:hypothetical protein